MPMTVCERIAEVIADRLETLMVNGTATTLVTEVVRPTRLGTYSPQDLQIVVTQGTTEEIEELSYPGNPPAVCHETTFNIRCHVAPDENSTTPKATYVNQFAADVRKAICTPVATWHNFAEGATTLAIDANFGPLENIDSDGGIDGVNIPLLVRYRTDEANVYTVRA